MLKLNAEQQLAVTHVQSPLFVLAGAGSGKTRVLIEKICFLIKKARMPAKGIYAVTFTNKAAREMRERLRERIDCASDVNISTFHTFGLQLLRQEAKAAGLKAQLTIFDDDDCQDLIRTISSQKGLLGKEYLGAARMKISAWKNNFINPAQAQAAAKLPLDRQMAEVYAQYEQHLRAYNAVDFDDLIVIPTRLLREDAELCAKWREKVRYLMVDEYQDTNGSQYQLVKQLMLGRSGLMVVGDDDQSIYAWRGANPDNLTDLEKDFPNLQVIKLEQNYRSTMCILKAAQHVINNNAHMYEKSLWSELGEGERVRVIACESEQEEAEQVVAEIRSHQLLSKRPFSDYAILYRSNHQAKAMEQALRQQQVPYQITGGLSFFSRTEIKDVLAYCRLLLNTDDDAAFLRVINTPRRGIGLTSLEKLGAYASQRHKSLFDVCQELGLQSQLTPQVWQKLQQFSQWFLQCRQRLAQDPIKTLYKILEDVDYRGWLSSLYDNKEQVTARMANIDELMQWLQLLCEEHEGDIYAAINQLLLRDLQQDDKAGEVVTLMTIHAAKGLEFPHVTTIGIEEEILPHRNSIETDNIAEERRLFYVAMTRAQRFLTLSYASQRRHQGKTRHCSPSRFLDELPSEMITGYSKASKNDTQEAPKVKSHLAAMRELLG